MNNQERNDIKWTLDSWVQNKDFQGTLEGVRTCKAYLEAPDGILIGFAHFTEDFYLFFEMIKGNEKNIILKDMKENIYKGGVYVGK